MKGYHRAIIPSTAEDGAPGWRTAEVRTISTVAGDVYLWETTVGWGFAPVAEDEPESFSEQYRTETERAA